MKENQNRKLRSKRLQSNSRTLRKHATVQEALLWSHLRNNQLGVKFRRQAVIDDKYIVDFVCLEKNLIIEVDGSQHAQNMEDIPRMKYLEQRGFKIIRFWNNEINKNLQACLEVVYNLVNK